MRGGPQAWSAEAPAAPRPAPRAPAAPDPAVARLPAGPRQERPATGPRQVLPPEHRPKRAAGTPSTASVEIQLPSWDAPSLHTAPVELPAATREAPARARRRGPGRLWIAAGVAALALVVFVVAQVLAQA